MARIFISYKREDQYTVNKIKNQIEYELGEECWMDIDGIESDAQFVSVIINAIDKAKVVLFMYSHCHTTMTDFENEYTIRELSYANKKNKRIVFINIDGSSLSSWFEFMYSQKQQVDGRNVSEIKKLIGDISRWLGIQSTKNANRIVNRNEKSGEKLTNNVSNSLGLIQKLLLFYMGKEGCEIFRASSKYVHSVLKRFYNIGEIEKSGQFAIHASLNKEIGIEYKYHNIPFVHGCYQNNGNKLYASYSWEISKTQLKEDIYVVLDKIFEDLNLLGINITYKRLRDKWTKAVGQTNKNGIIYTIELNDFYGDSWNIDIKLSNFPIALPKE